MKYDFTTLIDRHGKDALAVDGIQNMKRWGNEPDAPREGFDAIPMWVADMNFATAPSITKELEKRIAHPLYGYFLAPEEYYNSIIRWQEKRHGVTGLKKENIGYENGVHGCICKAIEKLTSAGDGVFMNTPYYVGFKGDLDQLGRRAVISELKKDENGIWRMNFEDMDRKIRENKVHLAIFCSPHNPTGRVWERWEVQKAMEVFEKNECFVISDEIWSDIVYTGHTHVPTQSVSAWAREHTIALYAPSKTFNLAGLIGSYHIIYSDYLKDRLGFDAYNSQNVLSMHALLGAYSKEGSEWTDELISVLEGNCRYMTDFIKENLNGVDVSMPQGTYMLFLDLSKYCLSSGRSLSQMLKAGWDVGVAWQDGRAFNGPCHIRVNAASPRSRIEEACRRMKEFIFL